MTELSSLGPWLRPNFGETAGRYTKVMPFSIEAHGDALFAVLGGTTNTERWRYIPHEVPLAATNLNKWIEEKAAELGWQSYVIFDETNNVAGMSSYMRHREAHGSVEIGAIMFGPSLARQRAATEAMYLFMKHVFDDLSYRRYEWKCHAENNASARAAERLGFTYEGTFRQDMVMKGRNRDTCWYSIIDSEWPLIKQAFETWLRPDNFDDDGQQRGSLTDIRQSLH